MTSLRKRQPAVEFLHLLRYVLLSKQMQPCENQTIAMSRFPKRQSLWMTPRTCKLYYYVVLIFQIFGVKLNL